LELRGPWQSLAFWLGHVKASGMGWGRAAGGLRLRRSMRLAGTEAGWG